MNERGNDRPIASPRGSISHSMYGVLYGVILRTEYDSPRSYRTEYDVSIHIHPVLASSMARLETSPNSSCAVLYVLTI